MYYYKLKSYNELYSSRFTSTIQTGQIILSADNRLRYEIEIFPNPATSSIIVKTNVKINSIKLYDLHGKEIQMQKIDFTSSHVVQIIMTDIGNGV